MNPIFVVAGVAVAFTLWTYRDKVLGGPASNVGKKLPLPDVALPPAVADDPLRAAVRYAKAKADAMKEEDLARQLGELVQGCTTPIMTHMTPDAKPHPAHKLTDSPK